MATNQQLVKTSNQPSINVQITQTKQNIVNLQNNIAAQQANFLKQQQQQQQQQQNKHMTQPNLTNTQNSTSIHGSNSDFFKSGENAFANERDSQGLSRFQTTWKSSFGKEDELNMASLQNEFSRAPGSISKSNPIAAGLLPRNDSINWAGISNDDTSGWPDVTGNTISGIGVQNDLKDFSASNANSIASSVQSAVNQAAYNLSDLVPEFEPGKPWKGTSNMKNIEDDPTITPGSITPSPLSINTIKDPLFNWPSKLSPVAQNSNVESLTSLPLSSSTWAFTPSSNLYNNTENKQNNIKTPGWNSINNETPIGNCSDNLWSNSVSKPRGPPPGLTQQIKNPATTISNNTNSNNIWNNNDNRNSGLAFLLLRNLTPQVIQIF